MKHLLLHVLGCALPLLAVFLLPLFGVSGEAAVFVFIVLMFGCHLLMLRGHKHHTPSSKQGETRHEHH